MLASGEKHLPKSTLITLSPRFLCSMIHLNSVDMVEKSLSLACARSDVMITSFDDNAGFF